jgi:TonB family protein
MLWSVTPCQSTESGDFIAALQAAFSGTDRDRQVESFFRNHRRRSMRPCSLGVIVFSLLSIPSFSAAAAPQNLAVRSSHHELRVERSVVSPEQIAYNVHVTDLDTGAVMLESHETGGARQPVDATTTSGDVQVHVRLAYTQNFFSAMVAVVRGDTVVDEFRTLWQLEARTQESRTSADVTPSIRAPGAYRVGGDVKAPRVVHRVNPVYPEAARHERISGIVILEVLIGKDGRVKDTAVLKGLPDGLSEAALAAVKQWEFEPATLNGQPVDVIFNLTTNFKIDAPPPPPPVQ